MDETNPACLTATTTQPSQDCKESVGVEESSSSSKETYQLDKQEKKLTPKEKKATTIATYEVLNPTDVLLGRGKRASLWQGNLRYKRIIYSFLPAYEAATKNAEKTGITGEIVEAIKRTGGRFLKENSKSGELSEVSDFTARLKVGQAMRHRRRLRELGEEDSDEELMATIGTAIAVDEGNKGSQLTVPTFEGETTIPLTVKDTKPLSVHEMKPRPADYFLANNASTSARTSEGSPLILLSQQPSQRERADVGNLNVLIEALKREEAGFGHATVVKESEESCSLQMPSGHNALQTWQWESERSPEAETAKTPAQDVGFVPSTTQQRPIFRVFAAQLQANCETTKQSNPMPSTNLKARAYADGDLLQHLVPPQPRIQTQSQSNRQSHGKKKHKRQLHIEDVAPTNIPPIIASAHLSCQKKRPRSNGAMKSSHSRHPNISMNDLSNMRSQSQSRSQSGRKKPTEPSGVPERSLALDSLLIASETMESLYHAYQGDSNQGPKVAKLETRNHDSFHRTGLSNVMTHEEPDSVVVPLSEHRQVAQHDGDREKDLLNWRSMDGLGKDKVRSHPDLEYGRSSQDKNIDNDSADSRYPHLSQGGLPLGCGTREPLLRGHMDGVSWSHANQGSVVNLNSGEALVKSFDPRDVLGMVDSDIELCDRKRSGCIDNSFKGAPEGLDQTRPPKRKKKLLSPSKNSGLSVGLRNGSNLANVHNVESDGAAKHERSSHHAKRRKRELKCSSYGGDSESLNVSPAHPSRISVFPQDKKTGLDHPCLGEERKDHEFGLNADLSRMGKQQNHVDDEQDSGLQPAEYLGPSLVSNDSLQGQPYDKCDHVNYQTDRSPLNGTTKNDSVDEAHEESRPNALRQAQKNEKTIKTRNNINSEREVDSNRGEALSRCSEGSAKQLKKRTQEKMVPKRLNNDSDHKSVRERWPKLPTGFSTPEDKHNGSIGMAAPLADYTCHQKHVPLQVLHCSDLEPILPRSGYESSSSTATESVS